MHTANNGPVQHTGRGHCHTLNVGNNADGIHRKINDGQHRPRRGSSAYLGGDGRT